MNRIALISEKYPPDIGGLAISVERLAKLLSAAGQDVEIFTIGNDLTAGKIVSAKRDDILVHRLGAHRRTDDTLAGWFDFIIEYHNQNPFELLHGYFITKAGFVAVFAGKYLGIPSVVSARGNDLDRAVFDPRKAAHILYALNNASAITANSRQLVRKAGSLAPGREVRWIPNGVDVEIFQPQPRSEALVQKLGLGNNPVIGFVGEARAKKGIANLLLAFRELVSRRPVSLILVGGVRSGEDKDLIKVFKKQNPDLSFIVVPYLDQHELPAYYNLLDILVMPSIRDGLPNVLLEGMACECAVIGTPVGGIIDVIRDDVNGRWVEIGMPVALANAMGVLLDDPEACSRLGEAARGTVMRDFSLDQEINSTLSLYRELLAQD